MACEVREVLEVLEPPLFSELGKRTRDLFNSTYAFGIVNLQYNARTSNNIEVEAVGVTNLESLKSNGYFEGRFDVWGISMKEKWTTSNNIEGTLTFKDVLMKGIKFELDALFSPHTGKRAGYANFVYKLPNFNMQSNIKYEYGGYDASVSSMWTYRNWLGGLLLAYDISNRVCNESNFAFGYFTKDFFLHTNVKNGDEFAGSMYHRVNENLESGVQLAWSSGYNATRFGLGCLYKLDSSTFLSAKVNNLTQVGVSFTHQLFPSLTLTMSALVDGKSIDQGGHKVGLGLKFQPMA